MTLNESSSQVSSVAYRSQGTQIRCRTSRTICMPPRGEGSLKQSRRRRYTALADLDLQLQHSEVQGGGGSERSIPGGIAITCPALTQKAVRFMVRGILNTERCASIDS